MDIKPLLVFFQPRLIHETIMAVSELNRVVDVLYVRFLFQQNAYDTARTFFLDRDYTHFVIIPDDLVVTMESYNYLMEDVSKGTDIIAGWCNNTATRVETDTNICMNFLSDKPPSSCIYQDYRFDPISTLVALSPAIIQCKFSGFAMQFISRNIIERIPFRSDGGCCVDTCLAHDLVDRNIPQYVDTRARMTHLRTKSDILLTGKKPPEVKLVPQQT